MEYIALIPIMIICVMANHMGLISAVENIIGRKLPVINCCKCSTFWFSVIYLIVEAQNIIVALAVSFIAAYLAVWLELLIGLLDRQYDNIYEKFFKDYNSYAETTNEGDSCAENESSSSNRMP